MAPNGYTNMNVATTAYGMSSNRYGPDVQVSEMTGYRGVRVTVCYRGMYEHVMVSDQDRYDTIGTDVIELYVEKMRDKLRYRYDEDQMYGSRNPRYEYGLASTSVGVAPQEVPKQKPRHKDKFRKLWQARYRQTGIKPLFSPA